MLRSMYAGISGMKSNQTKMDVTGNNVANASTTGYKKSSVRFADTLYQDQSFASAPTTTIGGVNPGQVGIGVGISGIFKNTVQGSIQPTNRTTDFAIDGDGYFAVKDQNAEIKYTRDGSFAIDKDRNLVTADGYFVLDQGGNKIVIQENKPGATNNKVVDFSVSAKGEITYIYQDGTTGTGQTMNLVSFKNPEGLTADGGNYFTPSANSGDAENGKGTGKIKQGSIEMSNVDIAEEFTEMMVTTRAFQAASKVITTSDELLETIVNLKR